MTAIINSDKSTFMNFGHRTTIEKRALTLKKYFKLTRTGQNVLSEENIKNSCVSQMTYHVEPKNTLMEN